MNDGSLHSLLRRLARQELQARIEDESRFAQRRRASGAAEETTTDQNQHDEEMTFDDLAAPHRGIAEGLSRAGASV